MAPKKISMKSPWKNPRLRKTSLYIYIYIYIYLHYRLDFSIIYIYIRIYIHYIIIIWGEIHWYLPMISRHWHSPAEPTNWCSRSSGTWRFAVFAAKDGGVQGQKLVILRVLIWFHVLFTMILYDLPIKSCRIHEDVMKFKW